MIQLLLPIPKAELLQRTVATAMTGGYYARQKATLNILTEASAHNITLYNPTR